MQRTQQQNRFKMSDFRQAATNGTVKTWEELAMSFCMNTQTAQHTCKVHQIKPSFLQVQQ